MWGTVDPLYMRALAPFRSILQSEVTSVANESEPAKWQASAVQLAALWKQVKARGLEAKVLARVQPATRAALENPWSARWHSGDVLTDVSQSIIDEAGTDAFADLNYDMTRESFGPIVRPLITVALAITGRSPGTGFARVPSGVTSALQNVAVSWKETSPNSGALSFVYPSPIRPETEFAWRGALRALAELAGSPARVEKVELLGGNSLHLHLAW